jgi:hypothetical protein
MRMRGTTLKSRHELHMFENVAKQISITILLDAATCLAFEIPIGSSRGVQDDGDGLSSHSALQ